MFNIEMNEVTKYLERHFILTVFLPSLLFWAALLLVCASVNGVQTTVNSWLAQSIAMQLLQIGAALAWVAFFAHLLDRQLVWITRQFEGYWEWPLGAWLRRHREKYYHFSLKSLDPKLDYDKIIYYRFPLPDESEDVMPTRLGNILKNSELYANQRYGIDSVLIWPRLYPILPESFTNIIDSAQASLDLTLIISTLSVLFACFAGGYLLVMGGSWWLFLLCFLGGLILAHIAYSNAIEAAVTHGQLVKSAFDLHKGDLIKKMGYQQPISLDQERNFWQNLCKLVLRMSTDE